MFGWFYGGSFTSGSTCECSSRSLDCHSQHSAICGRVRVVRSDCVVTLHTYLLCLSKELTVCHLNVSKNAEGVLARNVSVLHA